MIWCTGSIPPNLVLIHLVVAEETGFTDGQWTDRRMTDTCMTTVALPCSSTKQS